MAATVDQTIDAALRMNSLIGPGHTWASATSGVRSAAIDVLNVMLASWGVDGINVPAETAQSPFTLTAGTGSYTVGAGGAINITRPPFISKITYKSPGSDVELPAYMLTDDEYQSWPDKTTTSRPMAWHYKNSAPLGTLYILRPPDEAGAIILYTPSLFTVYTAGANSVILPDGYDQAIRSNLALLYLAELAHMGATMNPVVLDTVQRTARDAKAIIRRLNYRYPQAQSDFQDRDNFTMAYEDFTSGAFLYW